MWKTTSVDSRSSSPYNSWTKKKIFLFLLLHLIIVMVFGKREGIGSAAAAAVSSRKTGGGGGTVLLFVSLVVAIIVIVIIHHHFGILVSSINKQVIHIRPVAYCSIKYFLFSAIVSAPDDAVFVPRCCSHFSPRCHHGFVGPTSLSSTTSYQGPEER